MRPSSFVLALIANLIFWRLALTQENQLKCGVPPLNPSFSRLDIIMPEHRLVGGVETTPHAWPWTGQLLAVDRHQCGLALIEPDIVLTAAHCFAKSRNPARYKVLLGGHTIYSGMMFKVENISIHNLYQVLASAYDVALLKISPAVQYNETMAPVCLPSSPPPVNRMCVVTGWGRLKENGERSNSLREIHVPIIPSSTCNNFRHYAGRVHTHSMVCAGYNNGRVDSCQGTQVVHSNAKTMLGLLVGATDVLSQPIQVSTVKFLRCCPGSEVKSSIAEELKFKT
uniref:Peptidase S1 domain-containing protein n=1 Tax=Ditylenchus dipsaci TaxID=166011 RepID=A0A915D148_9BILA